MKNFLVMILLAVFILSACSKIDKTDSSDSGVLFSETTQMQIEEIQSGSSGNNNQELFYKIAESELPATRENVVLLTKGPWHYAMDLWGYK